MSDALAVTLTRAELAALVREAVADALTDLAPSEGPRDLMTRAEAAAFLRCSLAQLDLLARRDGLPFHLLGDSRRFVRRELLEWLTSGWASQRSSERESPKRLPAAPAGHPTGGHQSAGPAISGTCGPGRSVAR
jgi:excisionase family DNA binding protein